MTNLDAVRSRTPTPVIAAAPPPEARTPTESGPIDTAAPAQSNPFTLALAEPKPTKAQRVFERRMKKAGVAASHPPTDAQLDAYFTKLGKNAKSRKRAIGAFDDYRAAFTIDQRTLNQKEWLIPPGVTLAPARKQHAGKVATSDAQYQTLAERLLGRAGFESHRLRATSGKAEKSMTVFRDPSTRRATYLAGPRLKSTPTKAYRAAYGAPKKKLEFSGTATSDQKVTKMAEGMRARKAKLQDEHAQSVESRGVGTVFGTNSDFAQLETEDEQIDWVLDNATIQVTPEQVRAAGSEKAAKRAEAKRIVGELHPYECTSYALDLLEHGFDASGERDGFSTLRDTLATDLAKSTEEIKEDGAYRPTTMARELQKQGWTAVYFDVGDKEDGPANSGYTPLKDSWAIPNPNVVRRNENENAKHCRETMDCVVRPDVKLTSWRSLRKLRDVEMGIGFAHKGQHSFALVDGKFSEMHWDAEPNDGERPFEHSNLESFTGWGTSWGSGVVMLPPGVWESLQ